MLLAIFATFYLSLSLVLPHLQDQHWWIGLIGTVVTVSIIAAYYGLTVNWLHQIGASMAAIPTWIWLAGCILAGWVVRIGVIILFPPEHASDGLTYFGLAADLVEKGEYFTGQTYAYWPPGFPFSLVPGIYLFGAKQWVPALNNLILYAGTLLVVHHLARQFGDDIVARFGTLLVAIWPNFIFMGGTSSKEVLAAFLLPLAVLLYLKGAEDQTRNGIWRWRFTAGLAMGACILVQPSTILFPSAFVVLELCNRARPLHAIRRMVLLGLGIVVVLSPWTIRNYLVLDAFVPVGTAGGFSLLVGNNPDATGGYVGVEKFTKDFPPGEIAAGQFAKKRALQWIKDNPMKFLRLIPKKQILLLGDDGIGAYTIKNSFSKNQYFFAKGISNLFWLLIITILFTTIFIRRRSYFLRDPRITILMLPMLYVFCIHSITESGARHHIAMTGFLAVLAAILIIKDTARRDQLG